MPNETETITNETKNETETAREMCAQCNNLMRCGPGPRRYWIGVVCYYCAHGLLYEDVKPGGTLDRPLNSSTAVDIQRISDRALRGCNLRLALHRVHEEQHHFHIKDLHNPRYPLHAVFEGAVTLSTVFDAFCEHARLRAPTARTKPTATARTKPKLDWDAIEYQLELMIRACTTWTLERIIVQHGDCIDEDGTAYILASDGGKQIGVAVPLSRFPRPSVSDEVLDWLHRAGATQMRCHAPAVSGTMKDVERGTEGPRCQYCTSPIKRPLLTVTDHYSKACCACRDKLGSGRAAGLDLPTKVSHCTNVSDSLIALCKVPVPEAEATPAPAQEPASEPTSKPEPVHYNAVCTRCGAPAHHGLVTATCSRGNQCCAAEPEPEIEVKRVGILYGGGPFAVGDNASLGRHEMGFMAVLKDNSEGTYAVGATKETAVAGLRKKLKLARLRKSRGG